MTIGVPETELNVRGSASQRGRSSLVLALRAWELLSKKPKPGISSWKVHGTFWGMLERVIMVMEGAYLGRGEDGVDVVVGHFG